MKTTTIIGNCRLGLLLFVAGFLSLVAPLARADEEKDPPTRVARISFVDGSVSLQPGGQGDWGSAARNRPMTIGDKIWVDKDSRAELQAGQATIHLGSMTALSFLNLDQSIIQMRLAEGSLNFRVRELHDGDLYEVDAPNMAFTVKQAGTFRLDVSEDGNSARVTVIRGDGEVAAGGKTYQVHSGERSEFNGIENVEYSTSAAPGPDGLDRWAEERDLKEDRSPSAEYVPRDMPGYSDLDDHGTWSEVPDYGHVWYPNDVPPGWAPYSDGYWNWVGPWGWTWVGYAPWGFAPYHYGRWNYFGGRWGWCPGPYGGYPVYGPAFVGFFGGGFAFGVGWFPLGFGEPYYPWFHCRSSYVVAINVHNTVIHNHNVFHTNIRNVNFVNAHNVNAVTVANRNAFTNGQAINRGAIHITPAALKGAAVSNSVGLQPTRHSALGEANARSHVSTPSAAVENRAVMARTAPAPGASHLAVHTINSSALHAANGSSNHAASGAMNSRQRELSASRPPATPNSAHTPNATASSPATQPRGGSSRVPWEAQGNATDHGRAPAGFGSSNPPANAPALTARGNDANRPPWARSAASAPNNAGAHAATPNYTSGRPNNSNSGRSYEPPQQTNRGYTQPRAYNPPPTRSYSSPRTYSAPGRSYPAPSRSSSAPSHGSGGGGGGSHGGGSSHGGGAPSHGRH